MGQEVAVQGSPDRFGSLVQDREVGIVDEQTVALPPGDLAQHAQLPHVLQGFRHGRRGDADAPGSGGYRHNGVAPQVFEYAQRIRAGAGGPPDAPEDSAGAAAARAQNPFVSQPLTEGYAIFVSLAIPPFSN